MSEYAYGNPGLEIQRWRRVVDLLDKHAPGWRGKDDAFLGDYAMITILNALEPEQHARVAPANTFYVVRYLSTDPKSDAPSYRREKTTSNAFDTLEEAKAKALEWATKYPDKETYVVSAVTELGRTQRTAPPVEWRDAK